MKASIFLVTAVIAAFGSNIDVHQGSEKNEKKWDVSADLGPVSKLAFDTSEGTWMNLDVSPDGRQVLTGSWDGTARRAGLSVRR